MQAIVIFYKDADCKSLMQQLLVEFVMHSFKLFEVRTDLSYNLFLIYKFSLTVNARKWIFKHC